MICNIVPLDIVMFIFFSFFFLPAFIRSKYANRDIHAMASIHITTIMYNITPLEKCLQVINLYLFTTYSRSFVIYIYTYKRTLATKSNSDKLSSLFFQPIFFSLFYYSVLWNTNR